MGKAAVEQLGEFACLLISLLTSLLRHSWELGWDAYSEGAKVTLYQSFTVTTCKKGFNPVRTVQQTVQPSKDFHAKINIIPAEWTEKTFTRKA